MAVVITETTTYQREAMAVAQLLHRGGSSIGRAEDFESSDPVFESRSPRRP